MKLALLSFFICITIIINAQIDYQFVKHLQANNLHTEYHYYLQTLEQQKNNADSVNYLYAKLFVQQHNDSLFLKYYRLSSQVFNADTNALRYTDYYFLSNQNKKKQAEWFSENKSSDTIHLQVVNFYNNIQKKDPMPIFMNKQLTSDLKKYRKLQRKSPLIAACLSAFIPGLGKLYGQQPNSAALAFFSHGIYGYQSVESIKKYGIKNGFSIFSVSLFGLFYISNIYSSFNDLVKLKKQRKQQLLIDAEKYYHINYPASLY
jgi:hypothetical protein